MSKPKKRTPKPPNRVDPGWIHHVLASAILRVGRELFVKNRNVEVEVGDTSYEPAAVADVDGPEPADLLARLIAHVFYRLPGVRRLEKRLEGSNKSSGFFSDLGAFIVQLGRRNKGLLAEAITRLVQEQMNGGNDATNEVGSMDRRNGSGSGDHLRQAGVERSGVPGPINPLTGKPIPKE